MKIFILIGRSFISFLREIGRMNIFLASACILSFQPPLKIRNIVKEMNFIGVRSLFVIILTASFTGMVLALQGYYTLRKFGSEAMLGSAVALGLLRELGPVLASLMVTARAGSAIAAEIGTMKITEQIDALDVMTLNPIKYLVVPKIISGIIVLPLLVAITDIIGILGGYLVGVQLLGVNSGSFFNEMSRSIVFKDIYSGMIKALVFGLVITWICCYKGYNAGHGAKGISKATTEAVVLSAVSILVWDYLLTSILL